MFLFYCEGSVVKCFCGKEATKHVTVKGEEEYKYLDCPRCDSCTERAKKSYPEVEVKELPNKGI